MTVGGYREKSGRSKQGYYKGIYCGSTYELCWVIHALDHNVKFTRFDKRLEKDGVVYYPDFLLEDGVTIIEPKGYEKEVSVSKKTALAESLGYIVKVMRKNDLKYAFDYVEKTYGTKKFDTLYDEYKPKYTYVCANCGFGFSRDNKLKRNCKEAFCNRSCAGKKRKIQNLDILKKPNKGQFGHPENLVIRKITRKLTKEQALYIYYEEKKSLQQLANEFNLNKNAIWFIKQKKTYKWIHKNEENIFKPKSYKSVQSYQTERKNERLKFVKEVLLKFKEQKFKFHTQFELSLKIVDELLNKYSVKSSIRTFKDKVDYRNLVKEYIAEQANF